MVLPRTAPPSAALATPESASLQHCHCHRQRRRQRLYPSRGSWSSALALALVVAVVTPFLGSAHAVSYQPVSYSSTAILGSRLYIYGGLSNLSDPNSYTSQFATVSLNKEFDTNNIPWQFPPGTIAMAQAPGASSRDQKRFIIGGSRNNPGHGPAIVFDSTAQTWTQAADLPGGASVMQNYHRDSPGMALDLTNGMLVQFGGSNTTVATNSLTILNTNNATNAMTWSYSGPLAQVPALYAPIVLYIPNNKQTLIMGGCDQLDGQGTPTHCAAFDTLYTLSSDQVMSTTPSATRVAVNNGTLPSPRLMPCAVVMSDNNVLMIGGGSPTTALGDAWILNTQNWTWTQRDISGFPGNGIMGHSCLLAEHDQILVVGGHSGNAFMQQALSVIKIRNWGWTSHFFVPGPGFTTGGKVGLAITIVVVIGAIVAGLFVRWRRNKMAALTKAQGGPDTHPKSKHGSRNKRTGNGGGSRRRKRNSQGRQRSTDHNEHVELEGIAYHHPHAYGTEDHLVSGAEFSSEAVAERDYRYALSTESIAWSTSESSKTVVNGSSPPPGEARLAWPEQEGQGHHFGDHYELEQVYAREAARREEGLREARTRPDLAIQTP